MDPEYPIWWILIIWYGGWRSLSGGRFANVKMIPTSLMYTFLVWLLFSFFLAATLGGKQFWSGALPFCDKGTTPQSLLFEIIDVTAVIHDLFGILIYVLYMFWNPYVFYMFFLGIYMFLFEIFTFYAYFSLKFFNILYMFFFEILIFMFNMFMSMHTILAFHAVPVHSRFVPLQLLILFSTDTQRQ